MKFREKIALALTDYFLVMAGVVLGLGLRLDFDWLAMLRFLNPENLVVILFCSLAVFCLFIFGQYDKVWRYAGTHELIGVVSAITLALIPCQIFVMISQGSDFPRTALPLAWLVCIFLCGGVRLLLRLASEHLGGKPITHTRVIIVGANDSGESVLRELIRSKKPYIVVGFVDDDPGRSSLRIRGVRVLGRVDDLPRLIDAHLVTEIILAQSPPAEVRRVMDMCKGKELRFRAIPALSEMMEGSVQVPRLRELSIEDLLERDPIKADPSRVETLIRGKRVLVTGAGGSIGREIARQVAGFGPEELVLLGRGENSLYEIGLELPQARLVVCDVTRTGVLRQAFETHRPQVVFHAAAHKHVPMMESVAAEAVHNNVFGTLNVMEMAAQFESETFVLLSTDKAVNPTNVMGATKRLAELLVARQGRKGFAAVRFGNVLGSRGSVVPTFRRQIEQGGPVTITDPDMTRFFMTIPEAVSLVLQAGALARNGEIYILDMGKPVRILDLARNLIRLSGFEPDKDIEIRVIGSRPGEKTFEELVNKGEETEPSECPKVLRVVSPPPGQEWPGPLLEELRQASLSGDHERCRGLLQRLVPGYGVKEPSPAESEPQLT